MKPLDGVRVLDFSKVIAGPVCSQYLMDFGAEIIKIENISGGDDTRSWPPFQQGVGTVFNTLNRGKKSVALDLKAEAGGAIVRRLAKRADIVIESFAPSVKTRLGVDYGAMKRVRPDIVYCSISGFGQFGPMRDMLGYDNILQAYSGMMAMNGFPDRPPARLPISPIDQVTGINAAYGVMGALMNRARTGEGCKLEASLFETAISLLGFTLQGAEATGEPPKRLGSAHASICPYQVFETADAPILLGVANDRIWSRFCSLVGRPELTEDARFRTNADRVANRPDTVDLVADILRRRDAAYWTAELNPAGVPATRVNTVADVMEDRHTAARGVIERFADGSGRLSVDTPLVFGDSRRGVSRPPPDLGADTDGVLAEAGFDKDEIAGFRADHTVV